MGLTRLIKPALLFYECTRIFIIAVYSVVLSGAEGGNQGGVSLLFFAAPAVLFPLMALFLWLDSSRYRIYLPLFAAGKCIGIFSLLLTVIISGRFTMPIGLSGIEIIEFIILSCDLLALAAILFILKNEEKTMVTPNESDHPQAVEQNFQGTPVVEVE